jgi:hypothetical protein
VTDRCYDRHGKAEFLDFLKLVAKTYPRRLMSSCLTTTTPTSTTTSTDGWPRTHGSRCTSPQLLVHG